MFDNKWFKKHQRLLVFFANTWIGRKVLRINGNRSSVGNKKIIGILPNAIFWNTGNEVTAEFRTHNKFGKRFYYAFKPFWYLIHWWDMLFANNFAPGLNFGFDTLTTYPDADPETNTVDGRAYRGPVNETLATIIAGAGQTAQDSNVSETTVYLQASTTTDQYQYLVRSFYLFDTSSLGSNANITNAVFSLYSTTTYYQDFTDEVPEIDVVTTTPASNTAIAASDYGNIGSTVLGSMSFSSWVYATPQYNDITLNASGIANISKTGVSKFGTRINWDTDGSIGGATWVSNGRNELGTKYADETGTSQDPKLVITFGTQGNYFYFM